MKKIFTTLLLGFCTISLLGQGFLGNDTAICEGTCVTLSAPPAHSYEWSTGETTKSIEYCLISKADTVYCTYVEDPNSEISDPKSDTIIISQKETMYIPGEIIQNDTTLCDTQNCITLSGFAERNTYFWVSTGLSDNPTTSSIMPCPTDTTTYYLYTTTDTSCYSDSVTISYTDSCLTDTTPTYIDLLNSSYINIYPLPANGQINVQTNIEDNVLISIINSNGQLIIELIISKHYMIDSHDWKNGLYLYIIRNSVGNVTNQGKIIIQH